MRGGGTFTCSICGKKSTGYPNNAEPVVKNGWCCDDCNIRTVMPARIRQMMASGPQTRQGLQTGYSFLYLNRKGAIS